MSSLLASTLIGGAGSERGWKISLDSSGNVFVTGDSSDGGAGDFPTTTGAYDESPTVSGQDAFVSKLNSNLTSLLASTILGGASATESGLDITLDSSGNVYVAGQVNGGTDDFPTTSGAYDQTKNGSRDAFVSKLNNKLTSLLSSTLLGGTLQDQANAIKLDSSGNVFVAGYTDDGTTDFPVTSTTFLSKFGSSGTGNGQFNQTHLIAIDSSGNIYVTDLSNHRVQKFDSSGTFLLTFGTSGTGAGQFNSPAGIAIDSSGNIYVLDQNNHRVQKFNSSGTFVSMFGFGVDDGTAVFQTCTSSCQIGTSGTGDGQFNFPHGIEIDSSGNIYVAGGFNNRVQKFNSSGTFVSKFGTSGTGNGQFSFPSNIAFDSLGNIYVSDGNNHRVQKFNSSGSFILTFGSSGTGDGQFNFPADIVFDNSDNLYVSDFYNHRVQKFDSSGTFLSKFGTSGTGDGQFSNVEGLAFDSSGNLYIADYSNHRVQKFSPGAYDEKHNGGVGTGGFFSDVFVSKLNNSLTTLLASTFLGGSENDLALDLAIDSFDNVYVSGTTLDGATDFPVTSSAYDPTHNGGTRDNFVSKLSNSLSFLLSSTFLGGDSNDVNNGIAIDSSGNVYVTGYADAGTSGFPTTSSAYDQTHNGGNDVFVSKLDCNISTTSSTCTTVAEGESKSVVITVAGGTGSFQYSETEVGTTKTVSLDVTLPSATTGTITVATVVENTVEDGTNLVTAADITAPCTNTCTISFTVSNALLTAANLTSETASIYHDSNADEKLQTSEKITTTKDTTSSPGFTIFTASDSFTSKFAVGGVKALASGSIGVALAPTFAGKYFEDPDKFPLEINEIGYNLPEFENIIEKQIVDTGEPIKFKFTLFENYGGDNVAHFEFLTNLTEKSREYTDSDTLIIYEKNEPLEIQDPNGLFENIVFDIESANRYEAIITITITFAKEMPESDIYIRTWDAQRYSNDVIIKNAIEVITGEHPEPTGDVAMDPEPVDDVSMDPEPVNDVKKIVFVPQWIKNSAGWWSDGQINDETFIQGIEFLIQEQIIDVPVEANVSKEKNTNIKFDEIVDEKVTRIPDWVKNTTGWWSEGLLSDEEFTNSIKYLIENGTIVI